MLNGSSKAIALSLAVHLLLVYLLSSTISVSPHIVQSVSKPIDSYLYVPPPEVEPEPQPEPELLEDEPEPEKEQAKKILEQTDIEPDVNHDTQQIVKEQPQKETINTPDPSEQDAPVVTENKTFSAASSLNQLRALNRDLDDKMFEQVYIDRNKPNSGSIMHGDPDLVPHSVQPQSAEEKKKTATQQMGSGIAITKGEDGRCTITRDLSHVGMDGLTSVEGFSCGQTEMQKAFGAHMKKWNKKYGKLKPEDK